MKLTIIGSGTCIVKKERKASAYLLEVDDKILLFDCGWGTAENIVTAGYTFEDIDHIFITHPHGDHIGNLITILQSMFVAGFKYPERKREKKIFLHGYQGFKDDYKKLREVMFPERIEPYETEINEYLNTTNNIDGLSVQSTAMQHSDHFHSVGYRLETSDGVFVYSGDTGYCKGILELAQNADIAIIEAAVTSEEYEQQGPQKGHLSAEEVGKITQEADVKTLVLSHLYESEEDGILKEQVRKNFDGETIIAQDLLTIEVH